MKTGGDRRRRDRRHQRRIVANRVGAERLADVGVDIDAHNQLSAVSCQLTIDSLQRLPGQRGSRGRNAELGTGSLKLEGEAESRWLKAESRSKNKRASPHCDTLLPSPAWLPQHSRRTAVIRPATPRTQKATSVPARFSKESAISRPDGPSRLTTLSRILQIWVEPAYASRSSAAERPSTGRAADAGGRGRKASAPARASGWRLPDRSTRCRSPWRNRTGRCICTRPARRG
jgi:hypothetical protein